MPTNTHVVPGGNGIIGQETVRALLRHDTNVTSADRRPATVPGAPAPTREPAGMSGICPRPGPHRPRIHRTRRRYLL